MGDHNGTAFVASGRTVACLRALSGIHARGVMFATAGRVNVTRVALWDDLTPDGDGLQDTMDTLAKLDLYGVVTHRDNDERGLQFRLIDGVCVQVPRIPDCDVCAMDFELTEAIADARLSTGQWANVCTEHFIEYQCQLGTGRGQILVKSLA